MKTIDLRTLLQNSILTAEPLISPHLKSPPRGELASRVDIYINGFYGRLEEALASDYNTLAELLGEDEFSELCHSYIQAHPSFSYSLNGYGEQMIQFLRTVSPYKEKPYLAEIAAFEWAEYLAIVARDTELLSAEDLHSLPVTLWPEKKFYLSPSCKLITFDWNSLAMLQELRSNSELLKPKKLKTPQSVMIWRRHLDVRYCALERLELILIQAIQNHATFMELCDLISQEMPEDDVAPYLAQELHAWLDERLFACGL